MERALILLLAGFIVVFCVLILLIAVVTIYSKIVVAVQSKKAKLAPTEPTREFKNDELEDNNLVSENNGEIPGEIIAVIAAAVDAVYGEKPHKIRAVKKANSRSAWSRAGAAENTRPF